MSAANMAMKFIVLYTHHKTQKRKVWQDGYLKVDEGFKKASLYEENGNLLESKFLGGRAFSTGDEFELLKFLIQVESMENPRMNQATSNAGGNDLAPITGSVVANDRTRPAPEQSVIDIENPAKKAKSQFKPFIRHKAPRPTSYATYAQENDEISGKQIESSEPSVICASSNSQVQTITFKSPVPQSDSITIPKFVRPVPLLSRNYSTTRSLASGSSSIGRSTRPVVDFMFFSSDAVFRSSQGYSELPIKFKSLEDYQNYHIRTLEEYMQGTLEDLLLKVKSRLNSQGEGSRNNSGLRSTEFRIFPKGEIKVFNSGGFFSESLNSKGENSSLSKCESLQISLRCHHNGSEFSKDDIWILSTKESFPLEETVVLRSIYHGVSGGKIQGHALSNRDARTLPKLLKRLETVEPIAIRGSNIGTELTMMDNLRQVRAPSHLISYLMDPTKTPEKVANAEEEKEEDSDMFNLISNMSVDELDDFSNFVQDLVLKMKTENSLNFDQEKSLANFAEQFFLPVKPTLLIHGVFGSGKSHLIAVMIMFVTQMVTFFEGEVLPPKVLVASMTNTAVDNILQLLLKKGFDSFVRVGSLKRIQRSILPYAVQTKSKIEDDIRELRSMYDDDLSQTEIQLIDSAIKRFQSTDPKHSVSAVLQRTPVVGATCLASSFPCLDKMKFDIVILDEVSQLTEQMSMLPILKFRARGVVLVGDPLQLPPTIPSADRNSALQRKLKFTLFDRLMKAGVRPVMLRTQYRCHPLISNLSNKLFYSSKLMDGVASVDREPCLVGLPTLCFVNVSSGKEQRQYGKQSFHNEEETNVISNLIEGLFQSNVPLTEIGVISMYKLQVEKLEQELASRSLASLKKRQGVRISTVDAFQGAEMEVMIVSCVRSSFSATQFLNSQHRINVALTRGRRHLFLVGNSELLKKYSYWKNIIENHCKHSPNGFMGGEEFLSLLNVCPSASKLPGSEPKRLPAPKPKPKTGFVAPFRPPIRSAPRAVPTSQPEETIPFQTIDEDLSLDDSFEFDFRPNRSPIQNIQTNMDLPIDLDDSFQNFLGSYNPICPTGDDITELWDPDSYSASRNVLSFDEANVSDSLSQADPDFSAIFQRLTDD